MARGRFRRDAIDDLRKNGRFLSACDSDVRLFLIVAKGDNERFGKQTSFLVRDHRTGCRSPGIFLGRAS
jgi:hypothetical protein